MVSRGILNESINNDRIMTHIHSRTTIILSLLLVLALIACGVLAWNILRPSQGHSYYAVYLDTGDLYFGSLSRIPRLSLSDVWYIQSSQEEVAVNRFSDVVWSPGEKLLLNSEHIVWMNKLPNDSPLVQQLMEGPSTNNNDAVIPPVTDEE